MPNSTLYALYHKVSDEIEGRGGKSSASSWTYEIKRDLYGDLARTWQDKSKCPETVKEAVARRHGLKVVNKEIQIPDMRLEYANDPRHGHSPEGRGTRDRALTVLVDSRPKRGARLPDLCPAWRGRPLAAHSG